MADKYVQLRPTTSNEGTPILNEDVKLYPIIGPDSFKDFDPEGASPGVFKPQAKLIAGENIKNLKLGADFSPESLLGSGTVVIDLLNLLYPVGTIFTSVADVDVCPIQTVLGGTWERIKDTFVYAKGDEDTLGATGGSKDAVVVEHTHTMSNTGAHVHSLSTETLKGSFITRACGTSNNPMVDDPQGIVTIINNDLPSAGLSVNLIAASGSPKSDRTVVDATHTHTLGSAGAHTHSITNAGEPGTGKNMPPYLVVNMWKRVA